ncbi:hypothetical protein BSKO_00725 [Bryopsis sp. KO-2023]|nr:hypothetical protein BSKO_00725 [Bryopsis sp. KO-2023]
MVRPASGALGVRPLPLFKAELDCGKLVHGIASNVDCRKRRSNSAGPSLSARPNGFRGVSARVVRTATLTAESNVANPESSTSSPDRTVPKRVCIFVEPSPFTYVCGYKNRFCNSIKHLVEAGCEVLVVTTGKGVSLPGADTSAMIDQPEEYYGAKVISSFSVGCPWYSQLPLSLALSPRIYKKVKDFKPDLIHCTTPGLMVFSAWLYTKLLKLPLVLSYHTHLPKYLPGYNLAFLAPALWALIRMMHTAAQLTLATSIMLANELKEQNAAPRELIQVWKKGVDTDVFHPRFKSAEMRARLTDGHPEDPVMVHVGRLGAEKNLKFLKGMLEKIPNLRLAFVGDGPSRVDLQEYFKGTKTTFLGMLHGEELSAAYASADVFAMPSESETLGFVVLESMACQVPVVAVRAGGIPDIIHSDDVGGFLYESGDLEEATRLVKNLLDDDELRESSGLAARSAVSEWDWNAATLHMLNEQYPAALEAYKKQQKKKEEASSEGDYQPTPAPA